MRLAKFTESDSGLEIWVNVGHVESFFGDEHGTTISLVSQDIDVDERPEEVAHRLREARLDR